MLSYRSSVVDTNQLWIVSDKLCWVLYIDCVSLTPSVSLDACVLATTAALQNGVFLLCMYVCITILCQMSYNSSYVRTYIHMCIMICFKIHVWMYKFKITYYVSLESNIWESSKFESWLSFKKLTFTVWSI